MQQSTNADRSSIGVNEEISDDYREYRSYKTGLSIGLVDEQRGEIHPAEAGFDEQQWLQLSPTERNDHITDLLSEWAAGLIDYWVEP